MQFFFGHFVEIFGIGLTRIDFMLNAIHSRCQNRRTGEVGIGGAIDRPVFNAPRRGEACVFERALPCVVVVLEWALAWRMGLGGLKVMVSYLPGTLFLALGVS